MIVFLWRPTHADSVVSVLLSHPPATCFYLSLASHCFALRPISPKMRWAARGSPLQGDGSATIRISRDRPKSLSGVSQYARLSDTGRANRSNEDAAEDVGRNIPRYKGSLFALQRITGLSRDGWDPVIPEVSLKSRGIYIY